MGGGALGWSPAQRAGSAHCRQPQGRPEAPQRRWLVLSQAGRTGSGLEALSAAPNAPVQLGRARTTG